MNRRMLKFPALKFQHVSFMQEYQTLGHMSLATNPTLQKSHYYIPHHCVSKQSNTSTKLRVVFDASCTTTSQLSLNDSSFSNSYAMTADVTKMNRRVLVLLLVLVDQSFRKYQYIFWRDSLDAELQTLQLNTVQIKQV